MRMLRHLLMVAAFAIPTLVATAQDGRLFTFTTKPGEEVVSEVKDDSISIALRPNQSGEYYLYVKNPARADKTYTVELKGGPGSSLSSQVTVTIPGEKWKRVRLPKPAAPAAVPAVLTTPTAPDAKPAAPAEPLPPGSEIAATDKGFAFTLRLLDDKGNVVPDSTSKVDVIIQKPKSYIDDKKTGGTIDIANKIVEVKMIVTPTAAFKDKAEVKLAFPPQAALVNGILREGIYSRTIADGKPVTLKGAIENATDKLRVNIGVDGYDRAFVFQPKFEGNTTKGTMVEDPNVAVRVFPADKFTTETVSQPVAAFPVKIEVDNDNGGTLELLVRRVGAPADETEVIKVGRTRDERMWIDVAGPTDGGLLITNRSKDWIKPIDLRSLRGKCEIVAVLNPTAGSKVESSLKLIVDGTAPEKVQFTKLPAKHYKGKPLPVNVKATDEDTAIAKAVFFIGKLTDDGKMPPEAVKIDGKPVMDKNSNFTGIWTADLAFPPEKRGEVYIGVQFTDSVGLQTTQTQRIELVDAPPPSGTIEGQVTFGETRVPNATVKLMAEGKEKGIAKTNEYGRFKFEKVPVGAYAVITELKDSGFGKAGTAEAQVEADKTFKANISLVKKVK